MQVGYIGCCEFEMGDNTNSEEKNHIKIFRITDAAMG
jgi:hypothetical protein